MKTREVFILARNWTCFMKVRSACMQQQVLFNLIQKSTWGVECSLNHKAVCLNTCKFGMWWTKFPVSNSWETITSRNIVCTQVTLTDHHVFVSDFWPLQAVSSNAHQLEIPCCILHWVKLAQIVTTGYGTRK